MNNDLRRLPFLIRLSRQTRQVINQNFLLGIAFVIGGLLLAALKYINPIVAAVMHVGGSLLVVFNSFRLVRHGEELEPYQAPAPPEPSEHVHGPHCGCAAEKRENTGAHSEAAPLKPRAA